MGQVMQEVAGLDELIITVMEKLESGWVFFSGDIDALEKSRFLILTSEEDRDMPKVTVDGESVPEEANRRGMRSLLDVATLQDVIDLRRQALPGVTLKQYAEAIRHYVIEDDFLD